jgi:hypothetical protein
MEIAENVDEQKKDLPGMDLDSLIAELERVLVYPIESNALSHFKEIAEYDQELEGLLRDAFRKAARCELTVDELDNFMKISGEAFLADMESRYPRTMVIILSFLLVAMLFMTNTGFIDGLGEKVTGASRS